MPCHELLYLRENRAFGGRSPPSLLMRPGGGPSARTNFAQRCNHLVSTMNQHSRRGLMLALLVFPIRRNGNGKQLSRRSSRQHHRVAPVIVHPMVENSKRKGKKASQEKGRTTCFGVHQHSLDLIFWWGPLSQESDKTIASVADPP